MSEKNTFRFYFDLTLSLYKGMVYLIFVYPLFVAGVESFKWPVFRFLSFGTMQTMGLIFMVLTLVFFPLSQTIDALFAKGCTDIVQLGKRLLYAEIATLALSETITVFGLVIYLTSANLKFFYLFFVVSFIHLITVRPTMKRWQKQLDKLKA